MKYLSFSIVIMCLSTISSCKEDIVEPDGPNVDITDTEEFVVHSPSMDEFQDIVLGKMWAYVQTGYYDAEGNRHENTQIMGQHPIEAFWFHDNGIYCEYFWMHFKNNDQCTYNAETGMINRYGQYDLAKVELQPDGNVSLTYDFDMAVYDEDGNPVKGSYTKTIYAPASEEQVSKYSAYTSF